MHHINLLIINVNITEYQKIPNIANFKWAAYPGQMNPSTLTGRTDGLDNYIAVFNIHTKSTSTLY